MRSEVLSVYDRWSLEDFDVIAFAYSPVPEDVRSVVSQNFKSHLSSGGTAGDISESPHESSVLFFVDPSSRYAAIHDKQRKPKESMTSSTSFDLPSIPIEVSQSPSLLALNYSHRRSCSEPPAYRPTDSRGLERSNDAFSQPPISSASEAQDAANALSSGIMRAFNMMTSSLSMRSFVADKASSPIQSRLPLNRSRSFDELSICEMPPQTSIRSSLDEADDLLRGRLRSHSHTRDVPTRGSLPVDLCVGKRRRRSLQSVLQWLNNF